MGIAHRLTELVSPAPKTDDPKNWSKKKKNTVVLVIAYCAFVAPLASSIYMPAVIQVQEDLHTTPSLVSATCMFPPLIDRSVSTKITPAKLIRMESRLHHPNWPEIPPFKPTTPPFPTLSLPHGPKQIDLGIVGTMVDLHPS